MSEKRAIIGDSDKPPGYLGTIIEASGSHEWEKANHGINWMSGAFIFLNTALGACMLNAPAFYDELGGIATATLVQLVIILVTITTMYVMCACADLDDVDTYDEVIDYMCGRLVQKGAALSILIISFGICVTYLIIIGDMTDRIFATFHGLDYCQHWYLHRDFIIIVALFVFMWPLSCARHVPNVLFANYIGVFASFYIVFLAIYEFLRLDVEQGEIKTFPTDWKGLIVVLPTISLAYQSHINLIPTYGSYRYRSLKNMTRSLAMTMGILFIMYSVIGIFGYLTFGNKVLSDVLKQYDPSDPLVFLGIIAIVVKILATYPQMMANGSFAYHSFIGSDPDDHGFCRNFATNGIVSIFILYFALVTPNISQAIKFLGSICAIPSIILPGVCMTILANSASATVLWSRTSCIIMFIYGILIALFGIMLFLVIIMNVFDNSKSHALETLCIN